MARQETGELVELAEGLMLDDNARHEIAARNVKIEVDGVDYALEQQIYTYGDGYEDIRPATIDEENLPDSWFKENVESGQWSEASSLSLMWQGAQRRVILPKTGVQFSDRDLVSLYDPTRGEFVNCDEQGYAEKLHTVTSWMLDKLSEPDHAYYMRYWVNPQWADIYYDFKQQSAGLQLSQLLGVHVFKTTAEGLGDGPFYEASLYRYNHVDYLYTAEFDNQNGLKVTLDRDEPQADTLPAYDPVVHDPGIAERIAGLMRQELNRIK